MRAATPLWSEQIRALSLLNILSGFLTTPDFQPHKSFIALQLLVYCLHVIFYCLRGPGFSCLAHIREASIAPNSSACVRWQFIVNLLSGIQLARCWGRNT